MFGDFAKNYRNERDRIKNTTTLILKIFNGIFIQFKNKYLFGIINII